MTETRPKLGVIIGQTRDSRLADKPARWLMRKLEDDGRFDAELVDLRDFDLPFFNEVSSNLYVPSQDPKAVAWQAKVAEFDAYVFLTAEYNHSISGALKNALDQAYTEWNHKPFAAVGYGGVGAARAIEHLRAIRVELQMVPVKSAVHIGGAEFIRILPQFGDESMEAIEEALLHGFGSMVDDLAWWTNATRAARAADVSRAA